jgi:hypothetical protein
MKSAILFSTIAAVLAGATIGTAQASVIRPTFIVSDVIRPHWVHTGSYYVAARKRTRIFDRRKLGMLCVMPPDMQVALDWPGPACAYTDNFIFLPHRHHRH